LEPREESAKIREAATGTGVVGIPGLPHLREFFLEDVA
jgi:hypothetical protein